MECRKTLVLLRTGIQELPHEASTFAICISIILEYSKVGHIYRPIQLLANIQSNAI